MATILLVDDNPDIVTLLEMVLNQQGYQVLTGRNGEEGLNLLERSATRPDLIISNFHMPQMNGLDFLEHVRESPRFRSIPFIIITAAPASQWQVQAADLGVDAMLPKPFRIDLLRNTINEVWRQGDGDHKHN